jgi:cobalt/nickel transport system ATP-binding protein
VWLLDVLEEWRTAGRTVVIATHDLSAAEESCQRMIVLSEEHQICADGTPSEVLAQRELLLRVNLIHAHSHRHSDSSHQHPHGHGHLHPEL